MAARTETTSPRAAAASIWLTGSQPPTSFEYIAARCSPRPTSADFNCCGSPRVTASIKTSGVALTDTWAKRAAGLKECRSSSAWEGRTSAACRDRSARIESILAAPTLLRCAALRLPTATRRAPPEAAAGRRPLGRAGATAEDAVATVNAAKAPIAKKRKPIPTLPRFRCPLALPRTGRPGKSLAPNRRFAASEPSVRGFVELAGARHPETHAQDHQRDHADGDRREHVDLRTHAEPHLREHHHRQRADARAGGEARNHQIVPRERECQQPSGQDGGKNDRQRDDEEHLERAAHPDPWPPPRGPYRTSPCATARPR